MKPQQVAAAAGGKKVLNLNKMLICESTENGPIWTNLYLSLSFSLPLSPISHSMGQFRGVFSHAEAARCDLWPHLAALLSG